MEWYNFKDFRPEELEPFFVSKINTEDLSECFLGKLVVNDQGEYEWHVGNDLFYKVEDFPYWNFLNEKSLSGEIPENENELLAFYEKVQAKFNLFEAKFKQLSKALFNSGNGVYPLDYFVAGIINRALSLHYGFHTLIESKNYLSASHLVRPYLDSYLRLSAAWLVEDPHDFASKVWSGGHIKDIKDKNGKKMSDTHLLSKAQTEFPWMKNVYRETSGFVHFSQKHIAVTTTLSNEESRTLSTYIGKFDNNVSIVNKIEGYLCMIEVTNCLNALIFGWIDTKRIKE